MKKLSLVVPVYFEQECINQFLAETIPVLNGLNYEWEIVFIDDGIRCFNNVFGGTIILF